MLKWLTYGRVVRRKEGAPTLTPELLEHHGLANEDDNTYCTLERVQLDALGMPLPSTQQYGLHGKWYAAGREFLEGLQYGEGWWEEVTITDPVVAKE